MASTYLTRTPSSNGNRQKWTWSGWTKRSGLLNSGSHYLFASNDGSNDYSMIAFASDTLRYYDYTGSSFSSQLVTNRLFRDTNAWYHIVVAYDSTQGTSSNRIKLYVNGVQETSLSTATYPSQNHNSYFNKSGYPNRIGSESGSGGFYDGSMSHIHFTDGYVYDATPFGETDTTTGEWKIKTTVTGVTYGTNGYYILKDGNSVTDQSGQSNNLTVGGGTLTKTEDNPSNVFATLNPLAIFGGNSSPVLANGNTTLDTNASDGAKGLFLSSLGMTQGSGKFYCEIKVVTSERFSGGVCNKNVFLSSSSPESQTNQSAITYYYGGSIYYDNNGTVSGGVSLANGDILGIALDMDNNRLFFHKNGTYINSGDPTTSTGNVLTFTNASQYLTDHEEMFFFVSDTSTSGSAKSSVNFGNGYFGTTAVSSAGTNASGNGIFEYDVPTGYTALSTKGLNL